MGILLFILDALVWIIIIDAILSWVIRDADQFPRNITRQITQPLYAPVHAILSPEKTGGIDFSPLVLIILLRVLRSLLASAAF